MQPQLVDKKSRPAFVATVETTLIFRRLAKMAPGEVVTYDELSALIGQDVRGVRGYITSAMNRARNEYRLVFENVSEVGFKCLDDEGKALKVQKRNSRISSITRRGFQELSTVDYDKLNPTARNIHDREMMRLGVQRLFSSNRSMEKIEQAAQQTQRSLSVQDTLKLFVK